MAQAKKRATKKRATKKKTASRKTTSKKTSPKKTAAKRATKKRATKKRVTKKRATKKKAAKKKAPVKKIILPRVILQFTRNRRNLGRPSIAPPGANDVHLVFKIIPGGGMIVRAWWTKNGRRIAAIRVPRGANDAHLRIV